MELLFTSKYYTSYQSKAHRCFYIDFGHKKVKVSFCQLLSLRYKAKQLSSPEHLEYMLNHCDVTLLTFCDKEHIVVLDTLQVLDFTELIQGTFAMMELNAALAA
ncbi:hypothetical protein [Aquimarina sp. MMG016]|uniref:hypothetical protein n=1 Tax=Aquimarina sp. MMG016 TaxID=2822690 RepID=UPI001B3A7A50|nr:hypothetical protein [Aquimarina sp. MMG016]MBQ4822556.1 hypothetical protein [Aquimarina sp. MMG016]